MSARGPAVDRLLPLAGLPALDVPAAQAERAGELAVRHGMLRERDVDLADPVITRVERFAAERDRPAVTDRYRTLSYAELAAEACRIAALLEAEGVEPGTVVGVGGERCATVIAAFLAIELVGALYVSADETWPSRARPRRPRPGGRVRAGHGGCRADRARPARRREGERLPGRQGDRRA